MPTNPLVGVLTPQVRQGLYVGWFVVTLVIGVLEIVLNPDPVWLITAKEVVFYVAGALGLLAASNIAQRDPQPGPDIKEV